MYSCCTKEKIPKKICWNNLFINQKDLLGADLLQQGVLIEWLNRLNNIERPFRAEMMLAKVKVIKRIKIKKLNLCSYTKKINNGVLCQTMMNL